MNQHLQQLAELTRQSNPERYDQANNGKQRIRNSITVQIGPPIAPHEDLTQGVQLGSHLTTGVNPNMMKPRKSVLATGHLMVPSDSHKGPNGRRLSRMQIESIEEAHSVLENLRNRSPPYNQVERKRSIILLPQQNSSPVSLFGSAAGQQPKLRSKMANAAILEKVQIATSQMIKTKINQQATPNHSLTRQQESSFNSTPTPSSYIPNLSSNQSGFSFKDSIQKIQQVALQAQNQQKPQNTIKQYVMNQQNSSPVQQQYLAVPQQEANNLQHRKSTIQQNQLQINNIQQMQQPSAQIQAPKPQQLQQNQLQLPPQILINNQNPKTITQHPPTEEKPPAQQQQQEPNDDKKMQERQLKKQQTRMQRKEIQKNLKNPVLMNNLAAAVSTGNVKQRQQPTRGDSGQKMGIGGKSSNTVDSVNGQSESLKGLGADDQTLLSNGKATFSQTPDLLTNKKKLQLLDTSAKRNQDQLGGSLKLQMVNSNSTAAPTYNISDQQDKRHVISQKNSSQSLGLHGNPNSQSSPMKQLKQQQSGTAGAIDTKQMPSLKDVSSRFNSSYGRSLRNPMMRRGTTVLDTHQLMPLQGLNLGERFNKKEEKSSSTSDLEEDDSFTSSSFTSSSFQTDSSESNDDSNESSEESSNSDKESVDKQNSKQIKNNRSKLSKGIDEVSAAKNFIIRTGTNQASEVSGLGDSLRPQQPGLQKQQTTRFEILRRMNSAKGPKKEAGPALWEDLEENKINTNLDDIQTSQRATPPPQGSGSQSFWANSELRARIDRMMGFNLNTTEQNMNNNATSGASQVNMPPGFNGVPEKPIDPAESIQQVNEVIRIFEINRENTKDRQIELGLHNSDLEHSNTFKRSNHIYRETTMASKQGKNEPQGLYDEYYAALYSKDGYRFRDIYPEAAKKWILMPDDNFKQRWEIYVSAILVFSAITTPLRIAFSDGDDIKWTIVNYFVDGTFLIDIIICFFSAYEDENEDLVHDRYTIASGYMKSWFFIDVLSIIPLSEFLETSDFASLARIARLPKLYRLIRMFKLIRLLKVIKERNTISKYLNEVLKLSVALERLVFFCFIFLILVHIVACFWVIMSQFEDDQDNMITYNYMDNYTDVELYVACFYLTTVIVTTIGYGDITVRTPAEQCFALILLIVGVVGFSFAIGSLSSVLSSLDAKAAKLKEKLATLEDIRKQYKLPYDLYRRLRLALNYDHSKNADEQMDFLNELPQTMKVELSVVMHQELVKSVKFFRHKPPHFIAFLAPLLKPVKCEKDVYIYKEGDPIDEIYFLVSGQAGYALPKFDNQVYVYIDQGYYFGEIDFIFVNEAGENDGKRKFSAKSVQDCDLLILSKQDLLMADQEFEDVISELFQNAMHRLQSTLKLKKKCQRFFKRQKREKKKQKKLDGGELSEFNEEISGDEKLVKKKTFKNAEAPAQNEFMETLQKKFMGNNENQGDGQLLQQDMMKRMDEGQLDKILDEHSSKSSVDGSNSSSSQDSSDSPKGSLYNRDKDSKTKEPISQRMSRQTKDMTVQDPVEIFKRQNSTFSRGKNEKQHSTPQQLPMHPPLQKRQLSQTQSTMSLQTQNFQQTPIQQIQTNTIWKKKSQELMIPERGFNVPQPQLSMNSFGFNNNFGPQYTASSEQDITENNSHYQLPNFQFNDQHQASLPQQQHLMLMNGQAPVYDQQTKAYFMNIISWIVSCRQLLEQSQKMVFTQLKNSNVDQQQLHSMLSEIMKQYQKINVQEEQLVTTGQQQYEEEKVSSSMYSKTSGALTFNQMHQPTVQAHPNSTQTLGRQLLKKGDLHISQMTGQFSSYNSNNKNEGLRPAEFLEGDDDDEDFKSEDLDSQLEMEGNLRWKSIKSNLAAKNPILNRQLTTSVKAPQLVIQQATKEKQKKNQIHQNASNLQPPSYTQGPSNNQDGSNHQYLEIQ